MSCLARTVLGAQLWLSRELEACRYRPRVYGFKGLGVGIWRFRNFGLGLCALGFGQAWFEDLAQGVDSAFLGPEG